MVGFMSDDFSALVEAFKKVGVSRAYGPPLQIAGEELIPVALVSFGFGGGSDGGHAAPTCRRRGGLQSGNHSHASGVAALHWPLL